jgi:hypothetical protein
MDVMQSGQQRAPGREEQWAAQVQRDHPLWMVVYGDFSRDYVAFPLFPVPPGVVISDRNPADLAARLPRVEEQYGYPAHGVGSQ